MKKQQHDIKKVQTGKFLLAIVLALFSFTAFASEFGVNSDSVSEQQDAQNPIPTSKNSEPLYSSDRPTLLAEQQFTQASTNAHLNNQASTPKDPGIEQALPNYDQAQNNNSQSTIASPSIDQAFESMAQNTSPMAQDPAAKVSGSVSDPPPPAASEDSADENSAGSSSPASEPLPVPPPPDQSSIGNTEISRQAFGATVRNLMPLSPDQIRALHYVFDQSQRAASTDPGSFPPKPTSSAVIVNLSPGATPPVIRLRAGYITSLVFLDSTGEPWPIAAYDLGNPKSFNIQWDQKSNTLMVQALDAYQPGNLAVMLKDQNTPVMLTLIPGQQQVDYRVDLRVPGLGPNASTEIENMPGAENPKLLDFLNGTPPEGSQLLRVSDVGCQGWLFGNHLFLRTRLTVLSPGWLATMSSPDGTHVYELVKTPVVLASSRGKIIQLRIEGL